MLNFVSNFLKHSQGFTRNPLGIIALFISFIYSLVCLVLGYTKTLEQQQRWPLIWFLVFFPVLVLLSFVYLVAKHHKKLYGPGDYKDEKIFLAISNSEEQSKKLNAEAESLKEIDSEDELEDIDKRQNQMKDDIQFEKKQEITNDTYSLKRLYMLAEDLALRQLEIEFKTNIIRHASFTSGESHVNTFDGAILLEHNRVFIGVEVKYLQRDVIPRSMIASIISLAAKMEMEVQKRPEFRFKLLLAFVHENINTSKVQNQLDLYVTRFRFPIHIKFYDMNELKRRFGIE